VLRGKPPAEADTRPPKRPAEEVALAPQIIDAAAKGDLERVKALLKDNPELLNTKKGNAYGSTPLGFAAYGGHTAVVEFLLSQGAEVNVQNRYGDTPLHDAASTGRLDVVRLLLAKNADVSIKDKRGKTALDYAVERRYNDFADLLRQHDVK
jgi:ankyrin repeat protein